VRTYLFTEAERRLLYRWLSGRLGRDEDPHLHVTLGRVSGAWTGLSRDVRLLLMARRKLKLGGSWRWFHFAVGPIPLTYDAKEVFSFVAVQRLLEVANDPSASASKRLQAALEAAQEALKLLCVGGGSRAL